MSKHTPGVWIVTPDGFRVWARKDNEGYGSIVAVTAHNNKQRTLEAEANARLIAAAPDLLEALEAAMAWIDAWCPTFIYDPEWPEDEEKIRAAIAKAKGEA